MARTARKSKTVKNSSAVHTTREGAMYYVVMTITDGKIEIVRHDSRLGGYELVLWNGLSAVDNSRIFGGKMLESAKQSAELLAETPAMYAIPVVVNANGHHIINADDAPAYIAETLRHTQG